MHICRFTLKNDPSAKPRVGLLGPDGVRDVTQVTDALPTLRWPLPPGDQLITHLPELRSQIEALAAAATPVPRDQVNLLSPVANPGKFVCGVGNWKHHGAPLGMIGFLFKVTSALAGESDGVQIRWTDRTTVHEPELAMIIGRKCVNVSEEEALDYLAGYTCAFDMTMKEEHEDFSFCKAFDTYGVLGPSMVTAEEIANPSDLGYKFWVDGDLRGERSFQDLTGSPAQLVAFASTVMTLYPGDVILSGAADVGPILPGETMTIDIPRVGHMDVLVSVSPNARPVAA